MINICFLSGIVKSEVDLKFIYNSKIKSLSKKHTSIVLLDLEIEEEQIIKAYAYDEVGDWIYQNIKKGETVWIKGRVENIGIEINNVFLN